MCYFIVIIIFIVIVIVIAIVIVIVILILVDVFVFVFAVIVFRPPSPLILDLLIIVSEEHSSDSYGKSRWKQCAVECLMLC